jgi:predicted AAA+ superfamily ATPase
LISREVGQVAEVNKGPEFRQMTELAGAQVGGLLVPAHLASRTGLSKSTVAKYLAVLREIFVIKLIPSWTSGPAGRAVRAPKLAFVDSGLATELLGLGERSLMRTSSFGALLESFVAMELDRQAPWSEALAKLFHFRTKDGREVDIVLEDRRGRLVGIEVKASVTVRADDFKGLEFLSRKAGSSFLAGIVLYAGSTTASFGPKLRAMPISAIWQTP